jgi:hypothetical protein
MRFMHLQYRPIRAVPLLLVLGLSAKVLAAESGQSAASAKLLRYAPPLMQKLAKTGNVEFVLHNSVVTSLGTPGCTRYDVVVDSQYRYDVAWAWQGAQRRVTIKPTVLSVIVRMKHRIEVPEGLNDEHLWDERLVRHEFDHVTVSADPRIEPLISYLIHQVPTIVRVVDADQPAADPWCRRLIDAEVVKRREALLSLLQKNYDLLDAVTVHGLKPIKDRKTFFGQLYTRKNLAEARFPFLREVSPLLNRKGYRNLKPIFIE